MKVKRFTDNSEARKATTLYIKNIKKQRDVLLRAEFKAALVVCNDRV